MRRSWLALVTVLLAPGWAITATGDVQAGSGEADAPAAEAEAPDDDRIFHDFESIIKAEAEAWAKRLFINNARGVKYDRVRLVDIDWFNLLRAIRNSQLYLQSVSNTVLPSESSDLSNSFDVEPFADRKYQMNIERVDVYVTNGVEGIVLMGSARNARGEQGTWRISIVESERSLSGHINAPDGYTTFGPGPDSAFHVFRELSQESRRRQMAGKTY